MTYSDFSFTPCEQKHLAPKQPKKYEGYWVLIGIVFFTTLILYVMTTYFGLGSVARAAEVVPDEIHSLNVACEYAGLYPEKISNYKKLAAACKENGTPVQPLNAS